MTSAQGDRRRIFVRGRRCDVDFGEATLALPRPSPWAAPDAARPRAAAFPAVTSRSQSSCCKRNMACTMSVSKDMWKDNTCYTRLCWGKLRPCICGSKYGAHLSYCLFEYWEHKVLDVALAVHSRRRCSSSNICTGSMVLPLQRHCMEGSMGDPLWIDPSC